MAKSILLTFPDIETRDNFIRTLHEVSGTMMVSNDRPDFEERKQRGELLKNAIGTVRLNPSLKADHERSCGLWVSGQKLLEGDLQELSTRFEQEVGAHSARVVLKELVEGEWVPIRQRVVQR